MHQPILPRQLALLLSLSLGLATILAGCGNPGTVTLSTHGTISIQGVVHHGQSPVALAAIQLYRAGSSGNASAATPMLGQLVQTDSNGGFSIAGDYTCASSSDQVYIVATGGQPIAGTDNPALTMVDALGNCGNLSDANSITVNELTTVAAAWALSPFMTSAANIGASSTNAAGLANAFLDAQLLADPATGAAAMLASNLSVETGKLEALADALAGCVGSNGGAACEPLFAAATPTGGSAPADTLTAALNIVKHPGQNPAAVFNAIGTTQTFPKTLTQAPNDWTMTLSITGGGIDAPTALDIDSNGDVWVGGYFGVLSEFSPQGAPLSGAGFGIGDLNEVYGLTIDSGGNIWVSNEESSPNAHGSVSKFLGSNSATPGTVVMNGALTDFYDSSITFPVALAADTNGDIFIVNTAPDPSVTAYNSSGGIVATGLGKPDAAYPVAAAADASHGVWIANLNSNTVTHVDAGGNILSNPTCCDGANGIATDSFGNAWVSNYNNNSFSEVDSSGAVLIDGTPILTDPANSSGPAGIAIDAAQNIWIANYRGESIGYIAGAGSATPGAVLSPADGFGYPSSSSTAPLLLLPYDIIPDRSGNVWVSDYGNNNLVMFFGIAAPTVTPVQPTPTAP